MINSATAVKDRVILFSLLNHSLLAKLAKYFKLNYDAGIQAGFTPDLSLELIEINLRKL